MIPPAGLVSRASLLPHPVWLCASLLPHPAWLCASLLPHPAWLCASLLPHPAWLCASLLPHPAWLCARTCTEMTETEDRSCERPTLYATNFLHNHVNAWKCAHIGLLHASVMIWFITCNLRSSVQTLCELLTSNCVKKYSGCPDNPPTPPPPPPRPPHLLYLDNMNAFGPPYTVHACTYILMSRLSRSGEAAEPSAMAVRGPAVRVPVPQLRRVL